MRQKRKGNPAFRYTRPHGNAVRVIRKLLNDLYLVEAITRNGAFVTLVAEEDLEPLDG